MQKSNKKTIIKPVGVLSVRNTHEEDPIAPSKNHKGITLIALIITIIVMIILVGVTVNVALNGGLFETTEKAAKGTQIEADREILQVGVAGALVSEEGITKESLQNNLPEGWNVEGEGPFTVISPNGNKFTVNLDGTIETNNEEDTEIPEELTYWKTDGQGTILYYDIPEGVEVPEALVVPSQIGNEKITKIGNAALCGFEIERNEDLTPIGDNSITQLEDEEGNPIFSDASNVKKFIISEGIETIGWGALSYLSNCEEIVLPESLTTIGDYAFEGAGIESIKIPSGVKEIGYESFGMCTKLTKVEFSEGFEKIGDNAFATCNALETIVIPSSLIQIGSSAFRDCTSIQEITIPESVDNMGAWAFSGWTSDQTIIMEKTEEPPLVNSSDYSGPFWHSYWRTNCNANVIWNS